MSAATGPFDERAHQLVSELQSLAERSYDSRDLVPGLRALVDLANSTPANRLDSERLFLGLLDSRDGWQVLAAPGDLDILEYCMHFLRLAPVKEALESIESSAQDWRVKRAAQRVLEAYDDDWAAADIYGL